MYIIINLTLKKIAGDTPLTKKEVLQEIADWRRLYPEHEFAIYYLFIEGE